MNLLPAIPERDITPATAAGLERRIAQAVVQLNDVPALIEWQRRADALAAYLKDKEAAPYLWGAQRRIEARIGELLGKVKRGQRTDLQPSVMTEGLDKDLRSDFRQLAELVHKGLLRYEDDGEDSRWRASRRALLLCGLVRDLGGLTSSVSVEWYTPAPYVDAAREVMGGIDLDPASSELANKTVKATRYFDEAADGLSQEWHGRVWLNPPYGQGSGRFTRKLLEEYGAGRVSTAIMLLNGYGFDNAWFQPLWEHVLCFTDHRIVFSNPMRGSGGPANANVFIYFGPDERHFADVFSAFGHVVRTWPAR